MKFKLDTETVLIFGAGALAALVLTRMNGIGHHDAFDTIPLDLSPPSPDETLTVDQQPIPPPPIAPQIVQVPVPIQPLTVVEIKKTSDKSNQFAANVETLLRKGCPQGSLMPSSSACRANMIKFFPQYASAWATADSNLQKAIEQTVASSMNCCCTPSHTTCSYRPGRLQTG